MHEVQSRLTIKTILFGLFIWANLAFIYAVEIPCPEMVNAFLDVRGTLSLPSLTSEAYIKEVLVPTIGVNGLLTDTDKYGLRSFRDYIIQGNLIELPRSSGEKKLQIIVLSALARKSFIKEYPDQKNLYVSPYTTLENKKAMLVDFLQGSTLIPKV
jgi:hypothetical protein